MKIKTPLTKSIPLITLTILTILIITPTLILAIENNQTQQELYTETSYGIFYLILTFITISIILIITIILAPRIKEYT